MPCPAQIGHATRYAAVASTVGRTYEYYSVQTYSVQAATMAECQTNCRERSVDVFANCVEGWESRRRNSPPGRTSIGITSAVSSAANAMSESSRWHV